MNLSDYIGETTAYDKKLMLERNDPISWLKSVSAFANTAGGKLIFGVGDDGELAGLADASGDAERLSEAVKDLMDPVPQLALSIHEEDGKRFVILDVRAGDETPYYTLVKGHRVAYIRIGNESVKAEAVITSSASEAETGNKVGRCDSVKNGVKSSAKSHEKGAQPGVEKAGMKTGKRSYLDLDQIADLNQFSDLEKRLLALIIADNTTTYARLANECQCSVPTIQRRIRDLQSRKLLRRVGPDKGGHWEVVASHPGGGGW